MWRRARSSANRVRLRACVGVSVALTVAAALSVQAAPLGLQQLEFPDILVAFIDVTYDAGSDVFTASGSAQELDDDGVGPGIPIGNGTFELVATIDGSGALLGGSLTIEGTIPGLGFNSGTLLTGAVTDFGFGNTAFDPLEFLFDVTGGDAAQLYGGGALPGGIILSNSGFVGNFDENFDNDPDMGLANVAPVPLPQTVLLLASGVGGLCLVRRRVGGKGS